MERLQKVIAESGYTSRRKAEELIISGKVYVNGNLVTTLGSKVNNDDEIVVNGVMIKREDKVYYLLNKPKNYVSSVKDEKGRKTIVSLINTDKRIYPIGRLDYNTTGLIILTNDGELDNLLAHPSNHIEKTYIAKLDKYLEVEDILKFKKGLVINGRECLPTRFKVKNNNKSNNYSVVEITITEGRNHIVKNYFSELGYKVTRLHRSKYAFLTDKDLNVGEYRKLTIKEVHKLYACKYQ